jgi:hypothetical protein
MNFGDVGRICLNREIGEICQNCLWLEWDARRRQCNNCHDPVCPLGREKLLRQEIQTRGSQSAAASVLEPADAGLTGPLAAPGRESGIA